MKTPRFGVLLSAVVICISGFVLAGSSREQDKPGRNDSEAIKQRIVELERQWQQAVVSRDRSAVAGILARDFVEEEWIRIRVEPGSGRIRVTKRQAYLDSILKGSYQRYSISGDIGVQVKDPATAIANLRLTVEPAAGIVPLSSAESRRGGYDIVDTWIKAADGWHVSLRQASLVIGAMIVPLKNQD